MAVEMDNYHHDQSQKQPQLHLHAYMTNIEESGGSDSLKVLCIGIFEEYIKDADVVDATINIIKYYQS